MESYSFVLVGKHVGELCLVNSAPTKKMNSAFSTIKKNMALNVFYVSCKI